jgi:preprotein translocase subunit YajC
MPQQGNPLMAFMPIIIMFLIFYFLLIRPQQKQQKQLRKMLDELKRGDEVVTQGGLLGTVQAIHDNIVVLKLGEGDTKVECLKSAISSLRKKA